MLPKILRIIGLPVLIKFVYASLLRINNEQSRIAASALIDVDAAIKNNDIHPEELSAAGYMTEKSGEIDRVLNPKEYHLVRVSLCKEFKPKESLAKFWRPAFGYSVAFSWFFCMATICYIIINDSLHAAEIIMALVETTSLWAIALGVLGLSVVKTENRPIALKTSHKSTKQPSFIKEKNYGRSTFNPQGENTAG